ncbi:MAG: hypothetical protein JXQ89_01200 [Pelagimonas sp.]
MFKRLMKAALVFGMAAIAPPVFAQSSCAPRDIVVDRLKDKYTEHMVGGGLAGGSSGSAVVEIWSSEQTGTFTVLITNARGMSCIVASGTDYFDLPPMKVIDDIAS